MTQRTKTLLPIAVLLGGLVVAALIVAARPRVERVQSPSPPPLVRVVEARVGDYTLTVASQGTVQPRTESVVVSQVAGQVRWVAPRFAAGGFFRRGERMVEIDPRDYELAVEQAEARVAQAHVRLELEQAESQIARQEWEELGEGEPGALTLREPQLAEARAEVQAAQAALERSRLDLERTAISAPFDGRVVQKLADVGQFVSRGTPLASLYGTDLAEVELPVARTDLEFLNLDLGLRNGFEQGPEVRLIGSLGGEPIVRWARIARTASSFDPKTRMLSLFAEIEDPLARRPESAHAPLPIGLFVEAEITGTQASAVVALPRAAIREANRVFVVDSDDRLRFREVKILRFDGERALVSEGVEDGERICLSPLEAAVDGMQVRTVVAEEAARGEDA